MSIDEARKQVSAFIQNVHHFRDDCLADRARPPAEHVALFDEAQRAWNLEQTSAFMARKKGYPGFNQSEPEFLISCLDRHTDWATVVCLVGGGQEINTGEAGISEWVDALCRHFTDWDVHVSPQLNGTEFRAAERQRYLQNAYRVLLTRARQGMVIVIPEGDNHDPTRSGEFYDPTFNYLTSIGLTLLNN